VGRALKVEPSRQIIEGESVVFQCIVESSSVVAYKWYKNDYPINGKIFLFIFKYFCYY